MCGITGFISKDPQTPVERRQVLLEQMCSLIRHRGPDEQGTVVQGRAALGMRRLSIIDVRSGQQPIYNEDKTLAVVFNGEIYNFKSVRVELEARGHRFGTSSDTEVIVHAYEEFGTECVHKLRGMFAFAVWNFQDNSLFIARDRVGKKPLFYGLTNDGTFVFGSEVRTIFVHEGVSKEIDPAALDAYLTFGYVPEEFCIFKAITKLPPAHFLIYKNGNVSVTKYWDFEFGSSRGEQEEAEYVTQLREKLREAVNIRLVSEVPLGAFLSGGIDSAAVVAMMSELSAAPVKTFSIGFNEDSFNELKFARLTAERFGTEHHEFVVTPDLVAAVDEIVWHFDEPFADSSALPTFMVSKLAREFVTVALSGDGGDELFAGYTRYVTQLRRSGYSKFPRPLRAGLLKNFSKILPAGMYGKNYLYNVSLEATERYIDSISQFNVPGRRALYDPDFFSSLNGEFGAGERHYREIAEKIPALQVSDRLLYLDSKTYLPSDILTKVDRMSMANSLEVRSPLLDHELIEFVGKISSRFKIRGNETKYIFKKAMAGLIPDEILYREKQGFGVPVGEWIKNRLANRIIGDLRSEGITKRGIFKSSVIERLIDEHTRGRRDHSHPLWLIWILELWFRRYIDS
jgi:asparagine synthase (glutamine-hydrolysing)